MTLSISQHVMKPSPGVSVVSEKCAQHPPATEQSRHDRSNGKLEDLRHLAVRKARHVGEHDRLAIDEGQLQHRFSDLFTPKLLRRHEATIHIRLRWLIRSQQRSSEIVRTHSGHPWGLAFFLSEIDRTKDRKHPHLRGCRMPELIQRLERSQTSLLDQILRIRNLIGEAQGGAIE